MTVTGPWFVSSTAMRAPKTPRARLRPRLASSAQNASYSASAWSGDAASVKLGRLPLRVSAISVNWLTTSASPPTSSRLQSNLPASSSKLRRRATLPARRSASASESPRATPRRTTRPRPIPATRSPATSTRDSATRWTTARKLAQVFGARRGVLALRSEGARELVVAVRLGCLALLLEAAGERVVGVVVGGRDLEHRAELPRRVVIALDPEVRDAERLSDR